MKQELNLNCFDCNKSLQDCTCIEDTIDMKQETLEEAAERLFPHSNIQKRIFINGGKWVKERSYSEEEVGELIYNTIGQYGEHYGIMIDGEKINELFEQFKKK